MNTQHTFVRLFLGPLFLLWGAAMAAQAVTVAFPANDSLAAAGAWRNVANCFADDALYTTGTGTNNGSNYIRVGLADPSDTVNQAITSVVLYAKGYSTNRKGKIRMVPYFNGVAGVSSGNLNFKRTQVLCSFTITGQRAPWHWQDVVNLSVRCETRATGTFSINYIYAVVTSVDTSALVQRHYFAFNTIASPETLGLQFPVVIRALMTPGDTVMSSYAGTAGLTDPTGSVTPSIVTFTAGRCTSQVMIAQDTASTALTVADGDTAGTSNAFAVINPGLHHFGFDSVGVQAAGVPFPVAIVALDFYGDTVLTFAGAADLWDAGGAMTPDSSGTFSAGAWLGSVTVPTALPSDTIYCSCAIGGHTYQGQSNGFTMMLGVDGTPSDTRYTALSFTVSPNPARQQLGLDITCPRTGLLRVTLFNILGQVIMARDLGAISAGTSHVALAVPQGTMPGVYLVSVAVGDRWQLVRKVILIR